MNYEFGAFAFPSEVGTFGISVATLRIDGFNKRAANEADQGTFDSLDASYGLSYGRKMNQALAVGLTARYVKQTIDGAAAGAWSGDVGMIHDFNRLPLSVGLALRHFGQDIRFNEEGDPQPLVLDVGLGSRLFKDRLLLGLSVKKPRDNNVQFGLGSEWSQPVKKDFNVVVRTGYNSIGTDPDGTTGVSLGGGFGFRQFELDVAWVPFGDLGNSMRYALLFQF
jgi:hypothetical protein